MDLSLPDGVRLIDLKSNHDPRGTLVEVYRESWGLPTLPQLTVVESLAGVMRGVDVHPDHADYLMVLKGQIILGLHDIRPESPTYGLSSVVTLESKKPNGCLIPVGVAHGFYFPVATIFMLAQTSEWKPVHTLACRWDDPELGIDWPISGTPLLSDRHENASDLESVKSRFNELVANKIEP
jgi:dTDP-4-dehydrorhamnose 3,5-epimerase